MSRSVLCFPQPRWCSTGIGAPMLLLLAILVLVASLAGAEAAEDAEVDTPVATAPVIIDGITLFRVRGAESYPAKARARDIAARIVAVARDPSIDPATIRIEPSELGPRLTLGDGSKTLMVAVASEAQREGLTEIQLATLYMERIRATVTEYRDLRSSEWLLRATAWIIGATALLGLLWIAGRWAFRRLDAAISSRIETGVELLRIQSFRLLTADQAWRLLQWLLRTLRAAAALGLLYVYFNSTLNLLPWTRAFARGMFGLVLHPLITLGRSTLEAVPDLVFLAVLIAITRLVLRLIHAFFLELKSGQVKIEKFDPDWAMPTYRLVRMVTIAFALVVAFPYIPGSSTAAFKGVSLFAGVLISLGSSSVIGNIVAGYTMTYRRAFRDGDRIQVGDVAGDVTQTRLLVTHVRTPKNEDVVIPNSIILGNHVVNYSALSRSNGLLLHTTVGIGYEVPWRQVEAMLLLAANRTEGLLREPSPFVLETALADFAVTYELNAYCNTPQLMAQLYSGLHRNILDVFNEYGIQIMTPSYEADTPEPKIVPRNRWHEPPARPPDGSS